MGGTRPCRDASGDVIFAYLVLAHDAPDQLERLIAHLLGNDGDDFVVLHVDRRSPLWPAEARRIAASFGHRVTLIERPAAVRWGHFTQLRAIRLLIEGALERPFGLAHLVSGRDWRFAARAAVADAVVARPGACYIDTVRTEQQERMQHWWFHARLLNPRVEGSTTYRAGKKLLRIASRVATRFVARPQSYGSAWRKGSTWWSLPYDVCRAVAAELRALERSGRLRFTACSDEHVIQTIVATQYGERVVDARRYTDWSMGESSPKVLTRTDAPAILASGAWFARKVDAATDDWFLDRREGYDPAI